MTPVEFMMLFPEFQAPNWDGWRAILGHWGVTQARASARGRWSRNARNLPRVALVENGGCWLEYATLCVSDKGSVA